MTETLELDEETLDLVEQVFESLAEGYGIHVPTDEKQEMYIDAYHEIRQAQYDEQTMAPDYKEEDGEFSFNTNDIL